MTPLPQRARPHPTSVLAFHTACREAPQSRGHEDTVVEVPHMTGPWHNSAIKQKQPHLHRLPTASTQLAWVQWPVASE